MYMYINMEASVYEYNGWRRHCLQYSMLAAIHGFKCSDINTVEFLSDSAPMNTSRRISKPSNSNHNPHEFALLTSWAEPDI